MSLAGSFRAVVEQFGAAYDDYDEYYDENEDDGSEGPAERRRYDEAPRPLALVRAPRLDFALVAPKEFDDAQRIAAGLRSGNPVVVDLQHCGPDVAKRLVDFCSGLAYALDARLQFIGERVVLLAPDGAELSSDAPGALHEQRFYNQV